MIQNPNYRDVAATVFFKYISLMSGELIAARVVGALAELPIEEVRRIMQDWGRLKYHVRLIV